MGVRDSSSPFPTKEGDTVPSFAVNYSGSAPTDIEGG